jgi:hypothetical protein
MARFNRTFYDLNNERHYCFAAADEKVPPAFLSDLKLSIPSSTEIPFISGIFMKGETVKMTVVVGGQIVASYSSDNRSLLRTGRTYSLKSWQTGYEGIFVFGDLETDMDYQGNENIPIAEECLTRYLPSAIPYLSIPCTDIRLTGEVLLGGDRVQTSSFVENIPVKDFDIEQSMIFDLIDTGTKEATNPMVLYANGINALNEAVMIRSPIYSIGEVRPNKEGTIFIRFEDHFKIAAIVRDTETFTEETVISAMAVGSEITQDMVCTKTTQDPPPKEKEPDCPIEFVTIGYEP